MAGIKKTLPRKVSELLEMGREADSSIGASPYFSEAPAALVAARGEVATGTEKLQKAEDEARVGGKPKKDYRDQVKNDYVQAVRNLMLQVEAFAGGDVNILRSSGFPVREDAPPKPKKTTAQTSLRVPICTVEPGPTPGTWLASWKTGPATLSIEAHITEGDPTVAENWRHYGFFSHTTHAELTGLTSDKTVSLRFRALNGTEQGPWSPIHTLTPR